MTSFLQRLIKIFAYTAAGVVILLAISVGIFRLFLPRLPEYQEEIKDWASAVIGLHVEFSGMDARWGFSGPELKFYDAELISPDSLARIIAAGEVSIGVGLVRLIVDRKLVVDQIIVRDTSIELRQLPDGQWWIQGSPVNQLLEQRENPGDGGRVEVIGQNVDVQLLKSGDVRPNLFSIARVIVRRDETRLAVDADVDLPADLGNRLSVSATRAVVPGATHRSWDVNIEADALELPGMASLLSTETMQLRSGRGNIDLSLAYANDAVQSATADLDLREVAIADGAAFAVNGRVEYQRAANGWLVAADDVTLATASGSWPRSSLQVETITNADNSVVMLDARASYLNLDDYALLLPLLNESLQQKLTDFDPGGVVTNLTATLNDLDTETPRYDIAADFANVGIAASGRRPGVRGFTGALRADRSVGRLELQATDMVVSAPEYLPEPIAIDEAVGTIIWRRSDNRTIVLSDSISIRTPIIDSVTNVEVTIENDGGKPVVDLVSSLSIADIAVAKRFIPIKPIKEKLRNWFQDALVAGQVPQATVRFQGPLDKYPFEQGEGGMLIEASVRDAILKYRPEWPATQVVSAELLFDNDRLYSERNRTLSLGVQVIDAKVEIANVRKPILTISSVATGSLESMRQFALQSPISKALGGQLERVSVAGDGSFDLDLVVPIREWRTFQFTSRIRSRNGSLRFQGFDVPVTDLNGVVTIERDSIGSESLSGRFLERPVAIELMRAPATLPGYRVVADAFGAATASALVNELGIPLEDHIAGETGFSARLQFPLGSPDKPAPFLIRIESDLVGLDLNLPTPFDKPADQAMPVTGTISFPRGEQRIESMGTAGEVLAWQLAFTRAEGIWDFDRGVLAFGGVSAETEDAVNTRGLHLLGNAEDVRVQDWFDLSRRDAAKIGAAERIRSIDMTVANLHLLGQHLQNHHVRVDRSARDWLVQIEGDDVSGSVFVPYDLSSGRELVLEMARLRLPGNDAAVTEQEINFDPRSLPPISIRASEFALGDRYLGAVEVDLQRTDAGLVAEMVRARDDSFEIVGNGRWVVDASDPAGHRSFVTATLTSKNIARTMQRLNYQPGIVGDDMAMLFDLSWSGAPRRDFLDTLDGEVSVRLGSGQLDEVEPGAGRMFGLMSIVALPRRLALDFRDVFGKGFSFDKITGTFRIVDGETYTCDLSLVGPAADIGLVGRTNLVARDYEQVAVVNANFGNTLPVVGAFVAGPQVAAVMLIFSQLFKKPLQEMGQIYYSVSGSWDDPVIDTANVETFSAGGKMAGCLGDSE